MRFARLVIPLALLAVVLASSSSGAVRTPNGLHGFLLSASEPLTHSFDRTPAFAWNPIGGADHYELQLATSNTFRENSILWDDTSLQTPVGSPPLTLPWITGSPYALFARVRAVFANGDASPWSRDFGFDVVPPAAPTPLPSASGLLRWTPVDGADGYQVWLVDAGKIEAVDTNVLDEREFYSLHTPQWYASLRWRVRAIRDDFVGSKNGLPAAVYGPWSSTYTSTNPALTNGPIQLGETISDVVSDGSRTSSAHELMPGFTWTGNETLGGVPAQLFRVYVFTDDQCLNPVFVSSVVGSPAYAPRLSGPLALPESPTDLVLAQNAYLPDGAQTGDYSYDGFTITSSEQQASATPTTTVPGGSTASVSVNGTPGPPVDLWDVDWPSSGYYWTVIPVQPIGTGSTTVAAPGVGKGATIVPVSSTQGFVVGDSVTIGVTSGASADAEGGTVGGIGPGYIVLQAPLTIAHAQGEPITMPIHYYDMEMPQDVCAAGRIQRVGIASAPELTTGTAPYVTGLSSKGRLISSVRTPAFYGEPLVSWTPAPGARAYEVQWSKTRYPFNAQTDARTGGPGYMTPATSAILPLEPGTWWYRVRGFDYNLPSGAQAMAWSSAQKLVVAAPKYRVSSSRRSRGKFKVVRK